MKTPIMLVRRFVSGKNKLWQAWWLFFILPAYLTSSVLLYVLLPLDSLGYLVAMPMKLVVNAVILLSLVIVFLMAWLFQSVGAVASWQCALNCSNVIYTYLVKFWLVSGPVWLWILNKEVYFQFTSNGFFVSKSLAQPLISPLMLSVGTVFMLLAWILSWKGGAAFFKNQTYLIPSLIFTAYSIFFLGNFSWVLGTVWGQIIRSFYY